MRDHKTISGLSLAWQGLRIWGRIARIAGREYGMKKVIPMLKELQNRRNAVDGDFAPVKLKKVNDRIYFNYTTPAFPSESFDRFHRSELKRIANPAHNEITIAILAITKKCPLNCEHCFEGEVLNQMETLSDDKLLAIADKLVAEGVTEIQFSGGEPLSRFGMLVSLVKRVSSYSDTWVYTSGYGMSDVKAKRLADAGVTGISVSLEHYNEAEHNNFRRNPKAFQKAKMAIQFAQEAGLATCLSVCVVKRYASEDFLEKLAELCREWNITYLQLLEPRSVGNYAGQEVALEENQVKLLEGFYEKLNFNKRYLDYPLVKYHGYYQRRTGCFGGGNRSLYIDTDGNVEACPFCRKNKKMDYLSGKWSFSCAEFAGAEF